VTTFQPARPLLRWSRVASWRASSNGSLKVELSVPTRPMCSVTAAIPARTASVLGRPTTSRSWMRPLVFAQPESLGEEEEVEVPFSAFRAK
jgi:hypothetical protein